MSRVPCTGHSLAPPISPAIERAVAQAVHMFQPRPRIGDRIVVFFDHGDPQKITGKLVDIGEDGSLTIDPGPGEPEAWITVPEIIAVKLAT